MKWYMFKLNIWTKWCQYCHWRYTIPHDPLLDSIYIYIISRRKLEKDCLDALKLQEKWGHRTVSSPTMDFWASSFIASPPSIVRAGGKLGIVAAADILLSHFNLSLSLSLSVSLSLSLSLCVCVCACVRMRECVCACVCVCVGG